MNHYKNLAILGAMVVLFSAFVYLVNGCGTASTNTTTTTTTTTSLQGNAPTVTTFSPTNDAISVPVNSIVSATFSTTMDAATITTSTFTLTSSLGAAVSGSVTYEAALKTAFFIPLSGLTHSATYTATVSAEVKSTNGIPMAAAKRWNFTTVSSSEQSGWVVLTTNVGGDTPVPIYIGNYENRGDPTLGLAIAGENSISFSPDDQNIAWLVGNAGDVIKTTDGGQSANFVNIGTSRTLQSVWAVSDAKIFICGRDAEGSSLYYSSNGGTTWGTLESTTARYPDRKTPYLDRLYSLYFLQDGGTLYGWMAGGLSTGYSVILRSTNADATTWTESYYIYYDPYEFFSIAFFDKNNGIAVGSEGGIITTSDGGLNWTKRASGTAKTLYEVKIVGGSTAIITGGSGTVLKTTDKGTTWSSLDVSGVTTRDLYTLCVRGSKFWAGGDDGTIIYSADSGATWKSQTSNTVGQIQSIYMLTDTAGWAVGASSSSNKGVILKTSTGGEK